MKNLIKRAKSKDEADKGFTLVELLIVIVILGILATVTVFAVRGITDKGKTSACAADRQTLLTAVESYYANTGSYPASQGDLVPNYLASESAKYTYAAAGGSYTLTGVGDCAPTATTA